MAERKQIAELKKMLLNQRQELLSLEETASDAAAVVELDQTRLGRLSRMDALQGQAMSQERERRRRIQLEKIAAALLRIERGDYGCCAECGEAIVFERLRFDPTTTLCFNCANDDSR